MEFETSSIQLRLRWLTYIACYANNFMIVTPAKPTTTTTNVIIKYLDVAAENLTTSLFEAGAKRLESERLSGDRQNVK